MHGHPSSICPGASGSHTAGGVVPCITYRQLHMCRCRDVPTMHCRPPLTCSTPVPRHAHTVVATPACCAKHHSKQRCYLVKKCRGSAPTTARLGTAAAGAFRWPSQLRGGPSPRPAAMIIAGWVRILGVPSQVVAAAVAPAVRVVHAQPHQVLVIVAVALHSEHGGQLQRRRLHALIPPVPLRPAARHVEDARQRSQHDAHAAADQHDSEEGVVGSGRGRGRGWRWC
mmetsp:Transcript_13171/g.33141  ORF Transcript_13171/g.33141 Transcript_13171/m.33141 type:complete len:227 (+) Transcript_13171:48-728(+)